MRDYQPKLSQTTFLPPTVYKRVLDAVRDYPRLKKEYDDILTETGGSGLGISSGVKTSPTEIKAIKRFEKYRQDIAAIEEPLLLVPSEYRVLVLNKVINDKYSSVRAYVDERTIRRWKSVYLYAVADKMNLI